MVGPPHWFPPPSKIKGAQMSNVYAAATVTTFHDGVKVRVVKDQAWNADDPFVAARPDLFGAEPVDVTGTVEQATAAPGEKRATKRAARKTQD